MSTSECLCCSEWRAKLKDDLRRIIQSEFMASPEIVTLGNYKWRITYNQTKFHEIYDCARGGIFDIKRSFGEITNKPHKDFEWEFVESLKSVRGFPDINLFVAIFTFTQSNLSLEEIWTKSKLDFNECEEGGDAQPVIITRTPYPDAPRFDGLVNIYVDELFGGLYSVFSKVKADEIVSLILSKFDYFKGIPTFGLLNLITIESEADFDSREITTALFKAGMYEEAYLYMQSDTYDRYTFSTMILVKDIALYFSTVEQAADLFIKFNINKVMTFLRSCKYIKPELLEAIRLHSSKDKMHWNDFCLIADVYLELK